MIAKSMSDNLSRPIVREGIISIGGKNNSDGTSGKRLDIVDSIKGIFKELF